MTQTQSPSTNTLFESHWKSNRLVINTPPDNAFSLTVKGIETRLALTWIMARHGLPTVNKQGFISGRTTPERTLSIIGEDPLTIAEIEEALTDAGWAWHTRRDRWSFRRREIFEYTALGSPSLLAGFLNLSDYCDVVLEGFTNSRRWLPETLKRLNRTIDDAYPVLTDVGRLYYRGEEV